MPVRNIFDLSGRVAAVVGGGSGIGEAVALGAAAPEPRSTCLDVNGRRGRARGRSGRGSRAGRAMRRARHPRSPRPSTRRSSSIRVTRTAASTSSSARRASTCARRSSTISDDELDRVLDLNLKGNFNVLRAAGRIMTAQRRGSIVLFSSIRSLVVEPGQSVYARPRPASSRWPAAPPASSGPFGVRVNAIGPGVIDTPLTAPIKNNPRVVQRLCRQERRSTDGDTPEEMVGPDAVPGVGRRELRDRDDPVCGRRLAGPGRPVYPPM